MSTLEINLFGRFRVVCNQHELTEFNALKVQQLFCYLLLFRQRAHRRDFLSDLLWSENSTPLARKYLRKALWKLQAAMVAFPEPFQHGLLLVDADWIQVNPQAEFTLDIQAFDQGYAVLQSIPAADFSESDFRRLQSTLNLYRGDLLEGCDAEWCLYERERFKTKYLALVDKSMEHCEASGDYQSGIEYGSRALRCDPAYELAHWRLMRLYALSGDRTAAIRQFETCRQALKTDLDVEPSEKTQALYNQITCQTGGIQQIHPPAASEKPTGLSELIDAVNRINSLVEMQSTVQHQLLEQLATLEKSLKNLL
jgi:DNA-binding SARP family transcriptional activator